MIVCSLCRREWFDKTPIRLLWKRLKHKAVVKSNPEVVGKAADLDLKGSRLLPQNVVIDPDVAEEMQKNDVKPRFQPGIMRLKAVRVPPRLEVAAFELSQTYGGNRLKHDAIKLKNVLQCRPVPPQRSEIGAKTRQITQKLIREKNLDPDGMTTEEEGKLKRKVMTIVKYDTHHWKPIKYNAYKGMTYLVARLAQNYSVLLQCLSEISKRDPDFIPSSMYNLGSGLGSAIWAVNELWGKHVKEYYCVDTSGDMNTIARLLLQDADENKEMHIGGVYFRQFEPSSIENKFPLVISAYMLLELPDKQSRIRVIESLWERTTDYLLLVENGSYAGHTLIQEARDHIIKISSQEENSLEHGHVFAPCPHDMVCPKSQLNARIACTFPVKYMPMQIYNVEDGSHLEKFSYVLMRKRWPNAQKENGWPRFTMEVKTPSKCVHCKMCCPDGQFHHMVMTAKKHPKNLYLLARKSDWGDRLPVVWPDEFIEAKKDTRKIDKHLAKRRLLELEREHSLVTEKSKIFNLDDLDEFLEDIHSNLEKSSQDEDELSDSDYRGENELDDGFEREMTSQDEDAFLDSVENKEQVTNSSQTESDDEFEREMTLQDEDVSLDSVENKEQVTNLSQTESDDEFEREMTSQDEDVSLDSVENKEQVTNLSQTESDDEFEREMTSQDEDVSLDSVENKEQVTNLSQTVSDDEFEREMTSQDEDVSLDSVENKEEVTNSSQTEFEDGDLFGTYENKGDSLNSKHLMDTKRIPKDHITSDGQKNKQESKNKKKSSKSKKKKSTSKSRGK